MLQTGAHIVHNYMCTCTCKQRLDHSTPTQRANFLIVWQQVFRVKKLVGRRGAPELELLAVVIVLFAPILHESLTNSNFAMLFINITVFKDVCKRVSFVG